MKGARMKNRIPVSLLAVLAIVVISASSAVAQTKPIQIGDTLPGFFLKDMNGESFFLKDHIGDAAKVKHEALIFSLTASYCKPCRKEIPELGAMVEKYRSKGLGVYLIAVEKKEQAEVLVKETGTKLPVLIDRYLLVPGLIGRESIPCTLLVDKNGVVRFINTGFNEDNADEFIKKFEEAVVVVLGDGGSGR